MADYEYRSDILRALEQRLQAMTGRFSRTYVVHLVVKFPQEYVVGYANTEFSKLMKLFVESYCYQGVDLHYVGVREQNDSSNPHYHLAVFFDGSKVANGWLVRERAGGIWQRIVGFGGDHCVHVCRPFDQHYGLKIEKPKLKAVGVDRQNQTAAYNVAYHEAMTWLSYLAKTATKDLAPPGTRNVFCSQLWT